MNTLDLPEIQPPAPTPNAVFVYILVATTGAYYVGSAIAVSRRIRLHRFGHGAKFTHDYGAAKLVHVEGPFDLKTAVQREFQLKRWSRAKQEALVRGDYVTLRRLARSRA